MWCCWTDARGLHFKQPLGPKQNSRLEIFDENKNPETEPQEPRLEIWMAPPTARAKENEQKPEKWTNVKVRVNRFGERERESVSFIGQSMKTYMMM